MMNSRTVATQMTPTELKNIDPIATREELIQDIATGLGIKQEQCIQVKSLRMTPWETQQAVSGAAGEHRTQRQAD